MMSQKNYKESYEVDIFGNVKYASSNDTSLKIDKDSALQLYKKKRRGKIRNNSDFEYIFAY